FRPSLPNPAAIRRARSATSRQESRLSPHTSASPSPLRETACSSMAQRFFGRSQKAGTTRSPKRASRRMGGIATFDQFIRSAPHHRHADHDRVERKGKREISHNADRNRNQVIADAADRNRRRARVLAPLQRNAVEYRPAQNEPNRTMPPRSPLAMRCPKAQS